MRTCQPKRHEEKRGAQPNFGSSFYMAFLLCLGLPYVNWASQESCLFYLSSSLRSSDLPLFYFRGLYPSLSFSHRHSGLIFLFSNYLTFHVNVGFPFKNSDLLHTGHWKVWRFCIFVIIDMCGNKFCVS